MSATGIDVIPNLPKCRIPVLKMIPRLIAVSGTGIEFVPNVTGTFGIATVPNTLVRFGRVFTKQIPRVYFGTDPTEHTLAMLYSVLHTAHRNIYSCAVHTIYYSVYNQMFNVQKKQQRKAQRAPVTSTGTYVRTCNNHCIGYRPHYYCYYCYY